MPGSHVISVDASAFDVGTRVLRLIFDVRASINEGPQSGLQYNTQTGVMYGTDLSQAPVRGLRV